MRKNTKSFRSPIVASYTRVFKDKKKEARKRKCRARVRYGRG